MRITTLMLPALLAGGVAACGSSTGPAQDAGPRLDEEFTLAVGQTVEITATSITLTFRQVAADSRCPSDALILCVWEGDAEATVAARSGDAPEDLALHTNAQFDVVAEYDGFHVRLISLDPYPAMTDPIPEEDYRLTLLVSRR